MNDPENVNLPIPQSRSTAELEAWQPIETAPKDGTRIIVYRPRDNDYCYHVGEDVWRRNCWYKSPAMCQPTHWMPLPEAPGLIEQGRIAGKKTKAALAKLAKSRCVTPSDLNTPMASNVAVSRGAEDAPRSAAGNSSARP